MRFLSEYLPGMHWLLIGYMFLFIDRPFEVWPILGDWHVERAYMAVTLFVWLITPNKRWLPNLQHAAFAFFAAAVLVCWAMSPWMDAGQPRVEDWFKIVVFYGLLVTTVHDERGLKRMVIGFMAVMGLYLLHSLREYLGGRHTYRMGIARMIGVDKTLGDPNSFGATIVVALPFIAALWKSGLFGRGGRAALLGYFGLSTLCILLTGSRSSLLGLGVWVGLMVLGSSRRWLAIAAVALIAPMVFLALPDSLQNRFETIINPEVGPASARESGEGRIEGLIRGVELWSRSPITGVGPGAWRPATKSRIESHSLYGQLMGEMGSLGLVAFSLVLLAFVINLRRVGRLVRHQPELQTDFHVLTARAVGMGVLLLLVMGLFGHNLFRFNWLWYGGFLIIAVHCLTTRSAPVVEDELWEHDPLTLSRVVHPLTFRRNTWRI